MPLIQVNLIEGRSPEKIEQLMKQLTEVTATTLDAPKESVRVLVNEVPDTHWGVAGETMKKRRQNNQK